MVKIKSTPSPYNPEDALAAVVALRLMADRLERESIQKAIEQGWTWAQSAEALGVSKQAVHKKHAAFIKSIKGADHV